MNKKQLLLQILKYDKMGFTDHENVTTSHTTRQLEYILKLQIKEMLFLEINRLDQLGFNEHEDITEKHTAKQLKHILKMQQIGVDIAAYASQMDKLLFLAIVATQVHKHEQNMKV